MKVKTVTTVLLIAIIVAPCAPVTTPVPTRMTVPTLTFIPVPTATLTLVAPTPIPISTSPSSIKFSGEGNAFLTVNKWRGPALIHIDYAGPDRFGAWNSNEKDRLLNFVLFVDGNYSGTQVLDFSDKMSFQTYYLEISATGNWEIEILPFESGRKVSVPGVFTGSNNDVVFLEGGQPTSLDISVSETGNYFNISGLGDDGFVPIIDGAPPYHGTVRIEQDLRMLMIEVPGSWTINVDVIQ